ncbi:MAG TPA: hypothetical protein VJ854_02960 [Sphaerochaeta sp.]|nr:hypothetical protein [Sphaerochaeta sp.]
METIEEYNRARSVLLKQEPSILADALLTLAGESRSAHMLVTSLVSSTQENIALFKQNIHEITHQTRRNSLSGEEILDTLHRSLEMLDTTKIDPKLGLELMASFYETDSWSLESTTELDFEFSLLYDDEGFEKFADFAQRCPDPDFVVELVKRLLTDDGYGMRTKLLDEASTFLSEEKLKTLRT